MVRRLISVLLFLAVALAPWSGAAAAVEQNPSAAIAWTGPSPEVVIQVTTFQDDATNNGNCTLREAVLAANSDQAVDRCPAGQGADTIQLAAGTYVLSVDGRGEESGKTGDLDLTSDLRIAGVGQQATIISGATSDRLLHILSKEVHVQLFNLTLQKGSTKPGEGEQNGLGVLNEGALALNNVSIQGNGHARARGSGAGIYNAGTLTLRDSSVSQNTIEEGRGVGIFNAGALAVLNSQIDQNQATAGAGGGVYNTGTAAFTGCQLAGNGFLGGSTNSSGGAVFNEGRMVLEDCTVLSGSAETGALLTNHGDLTLLETVLSGGNNQGARNESILSLGTLTLIRSEVRDNRMRGIRGQGELSVHSSRITGNQAVFLPGSDELGGGGIAFDGKVLMVNSEVAQNQAGSRGGGIAGGGEWTILNSSIVSNTVVGAEGASGTGYGGGVYWQSGALTVTNSTVARNQAAEAGGGIFLQGGTASMYSVTIAGNSAGAGEGGGLALKDSAASLYNSLLAENVAAGAPDCYLYASDPESGEMAAGSLTSKGYNLIGVIDGCGMTKEIGDQSGTGQAPLDPLLGALGLNGGTTPALALLAESPAVDAGPASGGAEACPQFDQRGIARPQGAACDVGAFELAQTPDAVTIQIDILPGSPQNGINPNSQGIIPVAILSTTNFFSPAQVNPATLTFGRTGEEAALEWLPYGSQPNCSTRDTNRDGILDLICRFRMPLTGLREGDTQGTLLGETWNGLRLEGSDAVKVDGNAFAEGVGQHVPADPVANEGSN